MFYWELNLANHMLIPFQWEECDKYWKMRKRYPLGSMSQWNVLMDTRTVIILHTWTWQPSARLCVSEPGRLSPLAVATLLAKLDACSPQPQFNGGNSIYIYQKGQVHRREGRGGGASSVPALWPAASLCVFEKEITGCPRVACPHGKVTRTAISSKMTPRRKMEEGEYCIIFSSSGREVSRRGNGNLNGQRENSFGLCFRLVWR